MTNKKYKNPPIKEVICEIKFSKSSQWDPTIPGIMFERLRNKFPLRDTRKDIETELVINGEQVQPKITLSERAVFKNEEQNIIIQVGTHYLAVNHITPYTDWNIYVSAIVEAFRTYSKVAEPVSIERIELRHINQFDFDMFDFNPTMELKDYFDFYPFVGMEPKDYNSFIIGIQTEYGNDIQKVQLTNNDSIIILDTSYFSSKPETVQFEQIPQWLDNAHEHNNKTFEGCIKQSLREKFGEMNDS